MSKQSNRSKRYPAEFKRDAVELALSSDKTVTEVATIRPGVAAPAACPTAPWVAARTVPAPAAVRTRRTCRRPQRRGVGDLVLQVEEGEPDTLMYCIHTGVVDGSPPPTPQEVSFFGAWTSREFAHRFAGFVRGAAVG
ncbi:transposase [Kitasatospora sp. NPDC002227]|uniref:transposase n=1 Tax=Kitasatospora sp. NPDC002227 TaxID=3154773 RepID=UPI00332CC477